jgi:hypothetical protein
MRRRLYFVLPDLESAQRTADDLLLARVDDRNTYRRIEEVRRIVRDRHPEAEPARQEAHVPAFP